MLYPQNIEFQSKAERICAKLGVVPATIAIIKGVVHIGLGSRELNFIATNSSVKKISKREIGICLEKKISGATTVSSTSHLAHLAGIKVFSTGGIGGVHRGYKKSLDMSQDLFSLSRTPIVVVCSGVKSFLNVEKTIEALETFGVTMVGYKTNSFPLFYSSKSKNKLQYSFDTVGGLVGTYRENIKNKLQSSLLVLNPVPKKDEIIEEKIKSIVSKSISKMDKLGIVGNKTTPFLLSEIAEKTKNKSLETNISLALNNIKLGATIALKM
jgi:pseudouridine-5'-phosphate glycosidase